jgi:hypothetical protein
MDDARCRLMAEGAKPGSRGAHCQYWFGLNAIFVERSELNPKVIAKTERKFPIQLNQ